ncbi:hypothetical protein NUH88_20270 [Nisaea acidiphila]|uniref:Uncharacterized protein n=1 Tax=Nisaea acidiphila TaxID=1862145 RepID=A0A9J7ATB2_9PROT|nr:hypothetical protein [Nisaea acidiphila]UUX49721.1 hypothetical protein NUH88_20270 [Nisaea acidiphila]
MDIKSTLASQNVARTQTPPAKRTDGTQGAGPAQGGQGAFSVALSNASRAAAEIGEGVNEDLSREDALALAGSIAEQLAALPADTGIVSNPALLEEAARRS